VVGSLKKAARILLWVLAALFALLGIFGLADGDTGGGIVMLVLALGAFVLGRRLKTPVAATPAEATPPPPDVDAPATLPPDAGAPATAKPTAQPLWKRRPVIIGAVVLALIILGAAVSGDDEDSAQPAATTEEVTTAATTEAATTEAATTEAATTEAATTEAATAEAAETETEPVDTGKMSEGEFETFSDRLDAIDAEVFEYGQELQKCSVLLQALELAEASECVGEAYEGVGDDMVLAYSMAEDLEGDVGKRCLKTLRAYKQRLDVYYGWHERTQDAGENLQFDEFNTLAGQIGAQNRAYSRARVRVLRDCAPS